MPAKFRTGFPATFLRYFQQIIGFLPEFNNCRKPILEKFLKFRKPTLWQIVIFVTFETKPLEFHRERFHFG